MKDIRLDFENKTIIDEFVDNQDRIAQQIRLAVKSWQNDFFINTDFGVEYDVCWGDILLMRAYIAEAIKNVPGVSDIESINISKKKQYLPIEKDYFEIQAEIIFNNSAINILEIIGDFI